MCTSLRNQLPEERPALTGQSHRSDVNALRGARFALLCALAGPQASPGRSFLHVVFPLSCRVAECQTTVPCHVFKYCGRRGGSKRRDSTQSRREQNQFLPPVGLEGVSTLPKGHDLLSSLLSLHSLVHATLADW